MILRYGAVFVPRRPPPHAQTVCVASLTAEQLRKQLDNLQKEANSTRARANNARLRLIRLSEAAEKLRRQATINVQTGKENDARDLLFQKKRLTQAMEKLKNRIEVLDELSAKLNEAISIKENLLIGSMGSDFEDSETKSPIPIRIVPPKEANPNTSNDNQHLHPSSLKFGNDQVLQVSDGENEASFCKKIWNDEEYVQGLRGKFSYEDLIKNLELQLNKIEKELEVFLKFSISLPDGKEKPEDSQVQHVMEILNVVRQTRERYNF